MSIDFKTDETEIGSAVQNEASQEQAVWRKSSSGTWEVEDVEPWTEPVGGNALLNELEGVIKRYVVLPKWAAETITLWTVHTHAFQP